MDLLPKVDVNKTKMNARKVLSKYRRMKRRINYDDEMRNLVQAVQYSNMPKNISHMNNEETKIINIFGDISKETLDDVKKIQSIDRALEALPTISQRILKYSYCERNTYRLNEIAAKIKGYRVNEFGQYEQFTYSVKTVEKLKSEALIQFAEAYGCEELSSEK